MASATASIPFRPTNNGTDQVYTRPTGPFPPLPIDRAPFQAFNQAPVSQETPPRMDNIMNRRADPNSSLYQICINLKRRLGEVPGFQDFIAEMEQDEQEGKDATDPVTLMWNMLRRGFPLMAIYNALRPEKALFVNQSRLTESKVGKAATFKFLQACLEELRFPPNECFLITDLYGSDTTGFVKVTKVVNRVLDILSERGLLLHTEDRLGSDRDEEPQQRSHRQHVINELVTTERDYVQHLEILQHFKNQVEQTGAIAGDSVHDIFLNLNALLDFQRRFLIRVEQQNSLDENSQNWGQLFVQYQDAFKVYEPFLANQTRCIGTVMKDWPKLKTAAISPTFQDMLDSETVLLGFLMKPMQRLTKYPQLLQQLRKKGGLDEEKQIDLKDGESAASDVLVRANEAIDKEQRLEAVSELLSRVEDWKGHNIDHFGELMLYGSHTVLKGEGQKEVEREVRINFDTLIRIARHLVLDSHANVPSPLLFPLSRRTYLLAKRKARILEKIFRARLQIARTLHTTSHTEKWRMRSSCRGVTSQFPLIPKCLELPVQTVDLSIPNSGTSTKDSDLEGLIRDGSSMPGLPSIYRLIEEPPTHLAIGTRSKMNTNSLRGLSKRLKLSPSRTVSLVESSGSLVSSILPVEEIPMPGNIGLPLFGVTNGRVASGIQGGRAVRLTKSVFPGSREGSKGLVQPVTPSRKSAQGSFNGPFVNSTEFFHMESGVDDQMHKRFINRNIANQKGHDVHVRIQYKVYLFERILLCCKEINPNKPKNRLGNTKALVDKKGKLRLQLKGRIFMQNVTDVVSFSKHGSHFIQIFWKGDPGVENFVIRFANEETMTRWRSKVEAQRVSLSDSARSSGQTETSATEFLYIRNQAAIPNPYKQEDDGEEDDDQTAYNTPSTNEFSDWAVSRNASSTSLRSRSTTGGSGPPNGQTATRVPPPRFPIPDHINGLNGSSLTIATSFAAGSPQPDDHIGDSYFSPTIESPASVRSSQTGTYPFPRQPIPKNGWTSEDYNKHKTAPAGVRASSRDGQPLGNTYILNGRTVQRPSLPAMAASQTALNLAQSRNRSASTPDIHNPNNTAARRYMSTQTNLAEENVPVPPIPAHMTSSMRAPINRSQNNSPTSNPSPQRTNTQSPKLARLLGVTATNGQYGSDSHQYQSSNTVSPVLTGAGQRMLNTAIHQSALHQAVLHSSGGSDQGLQVTQLKVKIWFDPDPSHVTIVVPTIIKHQSLIDRIDSKMERVSTSSIAKGTARLRYCDSDGDLITMGCDEDVKTAIEEWFITHEDAIRMGVVPDFELFWKKVP